MEEVEVVFNYNKPGSEDLNYYSDIENIAMFQKRFLRIHGLKFIECFNELRETFKEEDLEPWTSCEFDFTREGNLKYHFDYIDWIKSGFDHWGKNYYMYKNLVIPIMEYENEGG
ncbi:TIGR01741 family protein [Staphylococcus aureus]|nr:TIGR01741 family protein [Staphylococcus aureus]